MLYTLTPGEVSVFKDIRMCNDLCPGTQEEEISFLHSKTLDIDNGTKLEPVYIIEKLSDPFEVLTYSISSSVTCIASIASLLSMSLIFLQ